MVLLAIELSLNVSTTFGLSREIGLASLMTIWMVIWWVSEVLPLGITALIPIVYLPIFEVVPLKQVTASYSNPVIYLFLGGFIIARALEKTNLSKRIALNILRITGKSDSGILIGFMLATTIMSMWISNTATTVMMVPIAMSVMEFLKQNLRKEQQSELGTMGTVLFLTIAYCANVGGITTPVGTPPNVVLIGYLDDLYQTNVDFWKWMLISVPVAVSLLSTQYFLLRRLFPFQVPIGSDFGEFVKESLVGLGSFNQKQKIVTYVFGATAFLWVFKGAIHYITGISFLNDTSIAIFGGVLLFLIPSNQSEFDPVLKQDDISHLPWNIVLLFGGGMAMAGALKKVGLIQITTQYLASFGIESPFVLAMILAVATLALTEVMSNVALCVVALPVMMDLGVKLGVSPLLIGIPVAYCSSFAFSMPVSTPPNAIVFGTGMVRVKDMLRAGILLNVLGIFFVMSVGWILIRLFY